MEIVAKLRDKNETIERTQKVLKEKDQNLIKK
jgi:hypothetical protein